MTKYQKKSVYIYVDAFLNTPFLHFCTVTNRLQLIVLSLTLPVHSKWLMFSN